MKGDETPPGFIDFQVERYNNTAPPGFLNFRVNSYKNAALPAYMDFCVESYKKTTPPGQQSKDLLHLSFSSNPENSEKRHRMSIEGWPLFQ
jgi:hypothetical protein